MLGRSRNIMKGEKNIKKSWSCDTVHRIGCSGSAYFLYGAGISSEIY